MNAERALLDGKCTLFYNRIGTENAFYIDLLQKQMKKMKQLSLWKIKIYSFLTYIGILCSCIMIGVLLLLAVYMLPVKGMKANVARSSEIFNYEGIYPQIVSGYKYMQLDNYTDSIMLGAAVYDGTEGAIDKAANNYHPDCEQLSPELALTNYANEVSAYEYFRVPYGRYWHGYLVPLKLLLLFFDYADIRVLNFFVQSLLLFMIIRQLYRIRMEQYAPAFLIMIFVLNPLTAALSLQFSSVYYIVLLSTIWFLHLVECRKVTESKINHLFFAVGILTAYFDLLTYPLVPFGILIVLYLVFPGEKTAGIKPLLQKGVLWGAGYVGMWSGKWLAGSILTRHNLFADALNQVFLRTSAGFYDGSDGYSRLDALWKNISVLLKWPFLIAFLSAGAVFLICLLRGHTLPITRQNAAIIFFLTATALLPVGWILITAGHAYGHYWFTYKELAVSCFALASLGIYLINPGRDEKHDLRE